MSAYIEKQVAIDAMKQLPHEYKTQEQRARTGGIAACQMVVRNLEPADVRPVVKGRWISDGDCIICSNCKTAYTFMGSNFCPSCGADMRGGNAK